MTTPTNQQIAAGLTLVNDTLRKAPEVNLDMMSTEWNEKNICGTPACFAGMYMALKKRKNKGNSYRDGTNLIAKACGFHHYGEFREWAYKNPTLWGNYHGYQIFLSAEAFLPVKEQNTKSHTIIPLSQVITWIDGVIGRLNETKS